jgi:hypothetical protein
MEFERLIQAELRNEERLRAAQEEAGREEQLGLHDLFIPQR